MWSTCSLCQVHHSHRSCPELVCVSRVTDCTCMPGKSELQVAFSGTHEAKVAAHLYRAMQNRLVSSKPCQKRAPGLQV